MKALRPFALIACFILIVGLACSVNLSDTPTEAPAAAPTDAPVQESPTEAPAATEVPPTDVPAPTEVPPTEAPVMQEFYTEEFDQDPGWNYFLTYGDEDKAKVEFDNSLMVFTLDGTDIYTYYINENFEYEDVRIEIRAENRGKNNNNVSLVCRYSDEGWYEFSTEGGGVWYLYAVAPGSDGKLKYNTIDNGGAKSLKQGKEVNEYAMTCDGNEITLEINGVEIKTIKENKFALRDGYVGFNISSLNVTPIVLEVDWFKVSEP